MAWANSLRQRNEQVGHVSGCSLSFDPNGFQYREPSGAVVFVGIARRIGHPHLVKFPGRFEVEESICKTRKSSFINSGTFMEVKVYNLSGNLGVFSGVDDVRFLQLVPDATNESKRSTSAFTPDLRSETLNPKLAPAAGDT